MTKAAVGRPEASEYGGYFGQYVQLVEDPDIIRVLENQLEATQKLLESISEEKSSYRYAPGKWSIKDLVGHIADTERVFSYRALRFSRNDTTELPGFDQDTFASGANYNNITLKKIAEECAAIRRATLLLYRHMTEEAWSRGGIANQKNMTVRATAFIIAGHELHHLAILKSRYLSS